MTDREVEAIARAPFTHLIKRLEAGETSFELCAAIVQLEFYREQYGDLADDEVPAFAESIDAALTLVPEGCWWEIGKTADESSPMRNFGAIGVYRSAVHWSYGDPGFIGRSDAPAIALCIAALKARAAIAALDKERKGE